MDEICGVSMLKQCRAEEFFCCIVYLETKAVIGQKNLSYEYIKYKISKLKNNMKILNKELLNLVLKT